MGGGDRGRRETVLYGMIYMNCAICHRMQSEPPTEPTFDQNRITISRDSTNQGGWTGCCRWDVLRGKFMWVYCSTGWVLKDEGCGVSF